MTDSNTIGTSSTNPLKRNHQTLRQQLENNSHGSNNSGNTNPNSMDSISPSANMATLTARIPAEMSTNCHNSSSSDDCNNNSSEFSQTSNSTPTSAQNRKRSTQNIVKDAAYWAKRRKNNEAARKSREKRRQYDMVMEERLNQLANENLRLKTEHRPSPPQEQLPQPVQPQLVQQAQLLQQHQQLLAAQAPPPPPQPIYAQQPLQFNHHLLAPQVPLPPVQQSLLSPLTPLLHQLLTQHYLNSQQPQLQLPLPQQSQLLLSSAHPSSFELVSSPETLHHLEMKPPPMHHNLTCSSSDTSNTSPPSSTLRSMLPLRPIPIAVKHEAISLLLDSSNNMISSRKSEPSTSASSGMATIDSDGSHNASDQSCMLISPTSSSNHPDSDDKSDDNHLTIDTSTGQTRYRQRREKNNEAAKRCRANRRSLYEQRFERAQLLQQENTQLKSDVFTLRRELEQLRQILMPQQQRQLMNTTETVNSMVAHTPPEEAKH